MVGVDLGEPIRRGRAVDVLREAVRVGVAVDPRTPPEGSKGIDMMLREPRARLVKLVHQK